MQYIYTPCVLFYWDVTFLYKKVFLYKVKIAEYVSTTAVGNSRMRCILQVDNEKRAHNGNMTLL